MPGAIPPDLLSAIIHSGRIGLIIGAGCSHEEPTGLPLARECSLEAHERLLADRVLDAGDCANPGDLSILADSVFAKTLVQRPLVERMLVQRFLNAKPNSGYLIAAALLWEGALSVVLTLNFDLALSHAVAEIGAGKDVTVIAGPDDHNQYGNAAVVYLHRNSSGDPEEWILRTGQLDKGWKDKWEEVVTSRVAALPHLIFAGLGSPAAVLLETVNRIAVALGAKQHKYQVDVVDYECSVFSREIGIPREDYIIAEWSAFMVALSHRLAIEHCMRLQQKYRKFLADNAFADGDSERIFTQMKRFQLLDLGRMRANWFLDPGPYLPHNEIRDGFISDFIQGLSLIVKDGAFEVVFSSDGACFLKRGETLACSVMLVSGQAYRTYGALEPLIARTEALLQSLRPTSSYLPIVVLVAGAIGGVNLSETDPVLIGDDLEEGLIQGGNRRLVLDIAMLRAQPDRVKAFVG